MKCNGCDEKMELKNEKKLDGGIGYTEYYWKCSKCGVEGVDEMTARRTGNSWRAAKKKGNNESKNTEIKEFEKSGV